MHFDWRSLLGYAAALVLIWAVARAVREAANIRQELVAQLVANKWSLIYEEQSQLWVVNYCGEDLACHSRPAGAITLALALEGAKKTEGIRCTCPVQYGHDPRCPRHGGCQ